MLGTNGQICLDGHCLALPDSPNARVVVLVFIDLLHNSTHNFFLPRPGAKGVDTAQTIRRSQTGYKPFQLLPSHWRLVQVSPEFPWADFLAADREELHSLSAEQLFHPSSLTAKEIEHHWYEIFCKD